MNVSRRGLLIGAGGGISVLAGIAAGVEHDVLPGRIEAYEYLGLNGASGKVPEVAGAPVEHGRIGDAKWWIARPKGVTGVLPLVLALHGVSYEAAKFLGPDFGLDRFLAASGQQFAIAAIDGGNAYWHPRADGRNPLALVLDQFLPLLGREGLEIDRPGLLGWSMGGYGALLVASELDAAVPVVAVSPAVWTSWDEERSGPTGPFDDEADYERWGIFNRIDKLRDDIIRIDCGRGDAFFHQVGTLTDELPDAEVHIEAGGHNTAYWTRVLPDQLEWLGRHLATHPN